MRFFVMDYSDPVEATGEYVLQPASASQIDQAIKAYEQFNGHFPYRENWRSKLLLARTAALASAPLTALIESSQKLNGREHR
jgi:hypothetical protein